MERSLAFNKARLVTDSELEHVSGGTGTNSVVRSGNPLVVESTDPGDQGGGGGTGGGGQDDRIAP